LEAKQSRFLESIRRATKGSFAVRKTKPGAVSRAGRNNSVSIRQINQFADSIK
jgi:hypothetical protein